jgi:hypothetical protein
LRLERDRLAADREQGPLEQAAAATARRYDELLARLQGLQAEGEPPRGQGEVATPGGRRGLGLLWSRLAERRGPPPDEGSLERRLDALRAEAAVGREQALRTAAEAARANLERRLAVALGRLQEANARLAELERKG